MFHLRTGLLSGKALSPRIGCRHIGRGLDPARLAAAQQSRDSSTFDDCVDAVHCRQLDGFFSA